MDKKEVKATKKLQINSKIPEFTYDRLKTGDGQNMPLKKQGIIPIKQTIGQKLTDKR